MGYGSLEYIPAGLVCHRLYNYVYPGTVYWYGVNVFYSLWHGVT